MTVKLGFELSQQAIAMLKTDKIEDASISKRA